MIRRRFPYRPESGRNRKISSTKGNCDLFINKLLFDVTKFNQIRFFFNFVGHFEEVDANNMSFFR